MPEPGPSMMYTHRPELKFEAAKYKEHHAGVKRVDLRVQCKQLPSMDVVPRPRRARRARKVERSDPMCVVFEITDGVAFEVGRTEVLCNAVDAKFAQHVPILHKPEAEQQMRLEVYDVDELHTHAEMLNLQKQDFIGKVDFNLGEMLESGVQWQKFHLEDKDGESLKASCLLLGEAYDLAEEKHELLQVTVTCSDLPRMDRKMFSGVKGLADPFLEIHRQIGGQQVPVFRTPVHCDKEKVSWTNLEIPLDQVCRGDTELRLRIKAVDFEPNGDHQLIGETVVSVHGMATVTWPMELVNKDPAYLKLHNKHIPLISFKNASWKTEYGFKDYLYDGVKINFLVAVNFSAPNGNPTERGSLHYSGDDGSSRYAEVLESVLKGVEYYDMNSTYTALSFGCKTDGRAAGSRQDLHLWEQENLNPSNIVQAYKEFLPLCGPSGSSNLAPVVRKAITMSGAHGDSNEYTLLLLFTNGAIHDMPETKQAIVEASKAAVSIVIIGVGQHTSFRDMEELDSDGTLLKGFRGSEADRDIVQFVEFEKYKASERCVARAVLAELPDQMAQYYRKIGRVPKPPTHMV